MTRQSHPWTVTVFGGSCHAITRRGSSQAETFNRARRDLLDLGLQIEGVRAYKRGRLEMEAWADRGITELHITGPPPLPQRGQHE